MFVERPFGIEEEVRIGIDVAVGIGVGVAVRVAGAVVLVSAAGPIEQRENQEPRAHGGLPSATVPPVSAIVAYGSRRRFVRGVASCARRCSPWNGHAMACRSVTTSRPPLNRR